MPIEQRRTFALHNYDEHPRHWGLATFPWPQVSPVRADRVTVTGIHRVDGDGGPVYAQVDAVDPDDASLDVLSIFVDDWLDKGGVDTGLEVWRVSLGFTADERPLTDAEIKERLRQREESVLTTQDFWLHNDLDGSHRTSTVRQYPRTVAKVVFPPGPNGWEGGAVTSMKLDGFEVLDLPAADRGSTPDHEKRLQLDRVSIANPPWAEEPYTEALLYEKPWTFVAAGSGPVRMFVTLRSPEFTYAYVDLAGKATEYKCHLDRVVSLYRHANYLVEDLYVKGSTGDSPPVRMEFAPHFFLKMHLHPSRVITQVPTIPDWLSIGTYDAPRPGYGFASTSPVRRIDNPPGDYPTKDQRHAAFGWQLDYAHSIRCLHLFRYWAFPWEVADDTGRSWFRLIFKPVRAALV